MFARSLRLTAVPSALRAACAPSSSAPAVAGALVAVRHKSAEALSYTERQALKGRPISPHVMIYAFPIVALSSITVRVTGALLAVGTSGIGIMALAGGDPAALMTVLAGSSIAPLAKFAVAFPFTYHFMGGVRHVIWDRNPEMLTNAGVEQASFAIFGAATAASVGAAIYTAD